MQSDYQVLYRNENPDLGIVCQNLALYQMGNNGASLEVHIISFLVCSAGKFFKEYPKMSSVSGAGTFNIGRYLCLANLIQFAQGMKYHPILNVPAPVTGGHLWIFFENNLPAEKTRKLMYELLREAIIISPFDKEPSFDRLFPNQDFHSGKGSET